MGWLQLYEANHGNQWKMDMTKKNEDVSCIQPGMSPTHQRFHKLWRFKNFTPRIFVGKKEYWYVGFWINTLILITLNLWTNRMATWRPPTKRLPMEFVAFSEIAPAVVTYANVWCHVISHTELLPNLKEYNPPTSIIFCNPCTSLSSIPSLHVTDSLPSIVSTLLFILLCQVHSERVSPKTWVWLPKLDLQKFQVFSLQNKSPNHG